MKLNSDPFLQVLWFLLNRCFLEICSGWVSFQLPGGSVLDCHFHFQEWSDESYRAQASNRLLKQLEAEAL